MTHIASAFAYAVLCTALGFGLGKAHSLSEQDAEKLACFEIDGYWNDSVRRCYEYGDD